MDIGSYQGEFSHFPDATRLIAINDDKGVVTADFSKELETSTRAGTAHALALTLRQFKERKEIKMRWEVIDKSGRQGEGDSVWLLAVKQQEQCSQ